MECPKCKNQLKDSAKFCGKCGTKIDQPISSNQNNVKNNSCEKCGNALKPGAKFCGKCGTPQSQNNSESEDKEITRKDKGYISWEMEPGQIALRITEKTISEYTKAKGIVIPEGYLAMILRGGKLQSMVEAGTYRFDNKIPGEGNIISRITGFFSNLFHGRKKKTHDQNESDSNEISQAIQKGIPIEIIVCRSSDFSLPFTFKEVPSSTIKMDVGLLISIQVSNLMNLYKRFMIDKTVLGAETFANELSPYIETTIHELISAYKPEKVNINSKLKSSLSQKLKEVFSNKFPYLEFLDIIKIDTAREELERLDRLAEEMYLSEKELEHLIRRNEFMNRLSQEQNSAELQNAANSAEFNQRLAEINKDNLLNEEEMANLQRDIHERSEDHNIDRARATELMLIQHQHDVQSAHIKMEEELGAKLFNIQMNRQLKEDEYNDNRREKDSEFADKRRRSEMDMDKEEQLGQMELLRQAQAVRQEREQAEHDRKMEDKKEDHSFEKDKLNTFANMTAEQIMVSNPNITKEAATAMAEKFKADAAAVANDTRVNDAKDQTQMMKEFMEQQMAAVRDIAGSNAQVLSGVMNSKDKEVERTHDMVDKNENRYSDVVREKIRSDSKKQKVFCSNCGQECGDEVFCAECGTRVEKK